MTDQLGDRPIELAYLKQMNDVARALDQCFNGDARGADRKVGFVLLVFEYGKVKDGARCN